jgi:hypothetical protein
VGFQGLTSLPAVFLLISAGCSSQFPLHPDGEIESHLDARAPFGLPWDAEAVGVYIPEGQNVTLHSFEESELPETFSDGEVAAVLDLEGRIQAYSYSYLHHSYHGDTEAFRKLEERRVSKAQELHPQLVALYGEADAIGFFNQASIPGFQKSKSVDGVSPPCSLWIREPYAIELCATRVILVDGIEMNLTYYNLDLFAAANQLREEAR